jgi:protein dithiol:quinone oxidoreductase
MSAVLPRTPAQDGLLRHFRLLCLGIFAACAGMLAFAIFYLQGQLYLDPCPMCVLQRYALFAIGIVALIAGVHNPDFRGRRVYAGFIGFFALLGGGVAANHTWVQYFPPENAGCAAGDLHYLVNTFSLAQALPKIFAGSGECSEVKWRFLMLSIPEWGLLWFVAFFLFGVFAMLKPGWFRR